MALSGDALIEAVAELRAQHVALDRRVGAVESSITDLRGDLNDKHNENRESIHEVRDGQQSIVDLIHKLDLKFAKFTGYAIGAGTVIGLLLKLIDHLWKQ